jgi:hypothetical protein
MRASSKKKKENGFPQEKGNGKPSIRSKVLCSSNDSVKASSVEEAFLLLSNPTNYVTSS